MRLEADITSKVVRAANGAEIDVLRGMRLSVEAGRLAALVGPSGCGKTTFLRCIAGLDRHFSGQISLPGDVRLGVVFQEPRLLPWRTVEENIRLAAPEASDAAVDQLFDVLRLAGHRKHYPGELSLGLARRVALARAFAVEPGVLLMDEPFVSLDAKLAQELRRELSALLGRRAVTTILVTHDTMEAALLADTVFLLSGRPAQVIGQVDITTPREKRSGAEIAAIAGELDVRLGAPAAT